MDFFVWVSELSGWYWLALGILFIALEMLVPSFIVVWPGLAAITIAILVAIFPNISGEWLVLIFAILSIGYIFVGRSLAMRLRKAEPQTTLNARAESLVGHQAKVVSYDNGEGKVAIKGVQWPAVWENGEIATEGQSVVIAATSGVSLTVKNM